MVDRAQIDALKTWLVRQALLASPAEKVVRRTAEALVAAGLPIIRVHAGMTAYHPQVESIGVTWRPAGAAEVETYEHGAFAAVEDTSPIYRAVAAARASSDARDVALTRYRLEDGEGLEFALLRQFQAEGARDYLCFIIVFGDEGRIDPTASGAVMSFCGDRVFSEAEMAAFDDLLPSLGAALRAGSEALKIRSILDTYFGGDVGRRVLRGEMRRGAVEALEAAILIADLRGFTMLSDEAPGATLTAMLDAYLDCAVSAVEAAEGTVLKFLGDGLIATFPYAGNGAAQACARALAAAQAIVGDMAAINAARGAEGAPFSTFDLALHAGEVLFGNVGAARRLDFTIVGPAVNEAARLETLCAPLDAPILASRAFVAAMAAPERFVSRGEHRLKGVRAPIEVFALA
ncbi:MAG: hypothetical protein GC206_09190 [Alphaproteobacteria bacterium]|nr:hypothetical protein [Alphaproteobacteria bacterium]